ncbi:hypothetical protein ACGC1H_002101 [Rhizoctonia solani]
MSSAKSYTVILKEEAAASTQAHLSWVGSQTSTAAARGSGAAVTPLEVKYKYESLKAYSAVLEPDVLATLKENGDVYQIVENTKVTHCADPPVNILTQNDAPWGLQRVSQEDPLPAGADVTALNYEYRRAPPALNSIPVDVYVLDTGVMTNHQEFGNRATWGWTYPGGGNADGHGHGTHVAGTIAGNRFGVAKDANIIAVKVLDDEGSATSDSVNLGIDWVIQQVTRQREEGKERASVINMSLGGPPNAALDHFANLAVSRGIHVCVAAGNDYGQDARNYSPARAQRVITVGATTINDQLANFSNVGPKVDILAPGQDIISAGIATVAAQETMSGTSMATPHVAGMIAWLISVQGDNAPAALLTQLQGRAITLPNIPAGTTNLLLKN